MITSEKGFKMQQWYYMKETMFGEEQVGPVADEDFKKLVYNGKLQPGSKIFCPTRTQGKWVFLKTFPSLLKLIKHGAAKREETKRLIKEQDRNIKNARKIARLEEKKRGSKQKLNTTAVFKNQRQCLRSKTLAEWVSTEEHAGRVVKSGIL
ncbi:hypothetical protein N9A96_00165 [bacterium]|nr:hypothetical protein [bacterium]